MFSLDDATVGRFSTLWAQMANVVIELDRAGSIVLAAGAVPRLLGGTAEQLQGRAFKDHVLRQDEPLWNLIAYRLGQGRKVGPVPLRLHTPDGRESAVELVAVPVDGGAVQLSLNPYQGPLGVQMTAAPIATRDDLNAVPEHFALLAKRLIQYGRSKGTGPIGALGALAGLDEQKADDPARAAKQLWILHRLLSETVSEGEALLPSEKTLPAVIKPKGAEAAEDQSLSDALPAMDIREVTDAIRRKRGSGLGTAGCLTVAGYDGLSESDLVRAAGYAVRKTTARHRHHSMEKLAGRVEEQVEAAKEQLKRFRQMVVQERFDVAVQPIINLQSQAVHHYEALVRFDPRYFEGSPFEMIRFAEEIGMIQDFDGAMVMKVISMIRRLRRIGYDTSMAVNLSGRSIQSPAFLRNLFRILEDGDDVRKRLSFELTESSRIVDLEATNKVIQRLRRLGHKVALDDFGAGAAGIQYLQSLDVDVIKIDRAYVVRAHEDADDRAFLQSMLDLAATRGIETVGEGVDNPGARDMLHELGVTYAQGYLFGRPAPVNEMLPTQGTKAGMLSL